jgi:hypothetical protein
MVTEAMLQLIDRGFLEHARIVLPPQRCASVAHVALRLGGSRHQAWSDKAEQAIAAVASIGEAKAIADRAAAIKLFAAKQNWSAEQRAKVAEIEIRSVRRLGELLKEQPKNEGGRPVKTGSIREPVSQTIAEQLDTTPGKAKELSHRAQLAASVPAERVEQFIAENASAEGKLTVGGLVRIAKEQRRSVQR